MILCVDSKFLFYKGYIWLGMLLLSRFSRVRLCATSQMAAHQAPPSLGFSRLKHWSGLPLPSPMHETEKWKWSRSVVSNSSQPHGLQPTRLHHPWDFPGKSTGVGCHCLLHWLGIAEAQCHLHKQSQKTVLLKLYPIKEGWTLPKIKKQLQGKLMGTGLVKRSYGSFS